MNTKTEININSEIGDLEGVILHTPGQEVENMTPRNAQRALYSDILNLSVVSQEYSQLKKVLGKITNTYQVVELLTTILQTEKVKKVLIDKICRHENVYELKEFLMIQNSTDLAKILIEGVPMVKNTLTKYLDEERFALKPLHNFFFTRDASVSIHDYVLISRMANKIRERESMIMEAIFDYHPMFSTRTVNPQKEPSFVPEISMEGGDILIAREDILVIGNSSRTTPQGIDYILSKIMPGDKIKHILVQELPYTPESFIHLDMVFTFLDIDKCMVYEPLILNSKRYLTIHIQIDNGKVQSITQEKNLVKALKKLGIDLNPLYCGGKNDEYIQEREQWHSGANFFALGPGKVIGYERNVYTIEELNKNGFEVVKAKDVITDMVDLTRLNKYVITIHGSELARGGGGCRCMTMPIRRKKIDW